MLDLKKSWLYQQLASIYGEDRLILEKNSHSSSFSTSHAVPTSSTHMFFPVQEGSELSGWVGIPAFLIDDHSQKLIDTLVRHQLVFMLGEQDSAEQIWQLCLQEKPAAWLDKWKNLGYAPGTLFGHVYLYVDEHLQDESGEWYATLKEIIENVLEQESYFLPLRSRTFVWIIPFYDRLHSSLDEILKGLVDTITAEWFINVLFYQGEMYTMPQDLRELIKRESYMLTLARHYHVDQHVVKYEDLLGLLVLESCSKETLLHMVDKLVGPIQDDQESLHTLQTFFRKNLNVSETAKALYIHRNSMQYRLEKLIEKTGIDVRRFEEAVKVYLAVQALGMIPKK